MLNILNKNLHRKKTRLKVIFILIFPNDGIVCEYSECVAMYLGLSVTRPVVGIFCSDLIFEIGWYS